ncbi:MAG: YIP1 family protein [Rhodobacteraceae bacterium]|nr:YIP1 family protein [Paracoccaceae bacterium]
MTGTAAILAALAPETLRAPRSAARQLFDLHLPSEARWLGLCLVVVLAVIETKVALLLMPAAGEPDFMVALSDPWVALPAQAVALVLVALAVHRIGALFGGRGSFEDALLAVVWVEFLMTLAQAVQFLAILALPPLGALLAIAIVAGFLWITANFIAELHGFQSLAKVGLGMIAGFAIIVTLMAALFAALGLAPPV